MEHFVLGIFQEHLAKFIVGFRKEQVNANLLNGKGEIKDVELNCEFLNENLAKVTPFIELESIHISKLSFQVTSWPNLKHAPIVIDIEDLKATIVEPLGYLGRDKRRVLQQLSREQLTILIEQGLHKLRGAYNLFDRILDNSTIEIRSVLISFQPRGKFKTKRTGPWTPPTIVVRLRHLKFVMMDEYGEEAPPEQVWYHNRHVHGVPHSDRTYMIYKRLSLQCSVGLRDPLEPNSEPYPLLKEAQVELHVAFHKRLRDAAILAVQVDVTLSRVEIQVDTEAVPLIAHAMAGIKYCTSKDRAFNDPLVPESEKQDEAEVNGAEKSKDSGEVDNEQDEALDDDDGDEDEADALSVDVSESSSESDSGASQHGGPPKSETPSRQASSIGSRNRPLIKLPNGIVIHDRISLSLSVHECTIRGSYDKNDDGYVQLVVKGLITEAIWPKVTREKGAYAQASLSFVSLQEKHGNRIRQILSGGMQHDIDKLPLGWGGKARPQKSADENFPLFEDRSIRPDPFGLRYTFPAQAFGLKMTINYVDKVSDPNQEVISVLHEIGITQVKVLMDSDAWCRAFRFAMNEGGDGFDPRWNSGDWSDVLTTDMLVNSSQPLDLTEHLQPTKELLLDENSMISSDLMNMTARLIDVEIRVPAAIRKDVRSCDIIMSMSETTLVVSSALPRTFLSGKIGSSVYGDRDKQDAQIIFPNDPSDLCYSLEELEDPLIRQQGSTTAKAISTFRLQLTLRGFSVRIIPVIPFCNANQPQQLVEPLEMTMIVCFEGEPPESPESNLIKIFLFISIQVHRLSLNCDLDVIAGALSTLIHHAAVMQDTKKIAENMRRPMLRNENSMADSPTASFELDGTQKMSKTLKNRRVLVKRQIGRSLETGGLSVSVCMQMAEFSLQLWRQNVPLTSPFRASLNSGSAARVDDTSIPLMKLMVFEMNELEVGAEWSVQASNRRVVLKCCLSAMNMGACDFEAESRELNNDIKGTSYETTPTTHQDKHPTEGFKLVELLTFGSHAHAHRSYAEVASGHNDILIRAEEQFDSARSLSLAVEVGPPGVAYIRVREIEALCLLLLEALLMPTGMRTNPFDKNYHCRRGIQFPDRSVGALLCWVIDEFIGVKDDMPRPTSKEAIPHTTCNDSVITGELDKLLHSMVEEVLPQKVQTLMVRVMVVDVLVFVPDKSSAVGTIDESKWLGLVVHQTTLLAGFFAPKQRSGGEDNCDIMNVLASSGQVWASFLNKQEHGLRAVVRARPSLYAATRNNSICVTTDLLVSEFEISCSYHHTGFDLSMGDSALVVKNLDDLNNLYSSLLEMKDQALQSMNILSAVLTGLRHSPSTVERQEQMPDEKDERRYFANEDVLKSFAEAELSMRGMRSSLSNLREVSELHSATLRHTLHRQQSEIDKLRYELFSGERCRIAALALISSQVTGWLRMGGTHTYGQRVSAVTTMWRYYFVLRKSLLIVLSAPGDPKPIDIICLEGAQLRPLAGGRRKRDVKRGFCIIERGGVVRFFVAENEPDFEKWILEINGAIYMSKGDGASQVSGDISYDPNVSYVHEQDSLEGQVPDGIVIGENSSRESFGVVSSDLDDMDPSNSLSTPTKRAQLRQRLSAVKASTKTKLGSAVQAARQRGISITGTDDDHNSTGLMSGNEDDATGSSTAVTGEDIGKLPSHDIETISETDAKAFSLEHKETDFTGADESANQPRRMGGRLASMKSGTKNRLGSALQAAKEKTKAAADQRRRRQHGFDPHDAAQQVSEKSNEPAHTADEFDMTEQSNAGTSFESDDIQAESFHSGGDGSLDHYAFTSTGVTRRSQIKNKLGAAVKSVRRSATQESASKDEDDSAGRFNLRRRLRDSAKPGGIDSIKLRGIYAARGNPVDLLGVEDVPDDVPLQRIEGYWVVNVVACAVTSAFTAASESRKGVEEHQPLSTMHECEPDEGDTLNKDNASEFEVCPHQAADQMDTPGPSALPEPNVPLDRAFRISFLSHIDASAEGDTRQVSEVVRSLSDILALHTTISDCVYRILSSEGHKVYNSTNNVDEASRSNAIALSDMPPLDIVRFTGKLLNGLLEAGSAETEESKSFADHRGEVLKEFLNSLLDCPLPHDGIEAIFRFLDVPSGLESSSVHEVETLAMSLAVPTSDSSEPTKQTSFAFTQEILACLTSCETDLLRAEHQGRQLQNMFETALEREITRSAATPHSVVAAAMAATRNPFLEPLLPSKIIENLHDAMHGALMNVMAERDESNAQLIATSVLHLYEIEAEKKKVDRLNEQLRTTRASANSNHKSEKNIKKMSTAEEQMMQSSDAEMIALCQNLACEISEKTSAKLEIIRLKESRNIERENERAEKEALQNELRRCRELLAAEEQKVHQAREEALAWKKTANGNGKDSST